MAPTNLLTISQDDVRLRWKEEYITAAVNRMQSAYLPQGIIRGGLLRAHPSENLKVQILGDPKFGDIVMAYRNPNGFLTAVTLDTAPVTLDLATLASQTVYICAFVDYAVTADTVAYWRAYTQADFDAAPEKDYLVVWGKVVVPASGLIPSANVDQKSRRDGWRNLSQGLMPWTQVVKNGSFEWKLANWAASGFVSTDADAHSGVRCASVATGAASLQQFVGVPVVEGGLVHVSAWLKFTGATGTVRVIVRFADKDGVVTPSGYPIDLSPSGLTQDWTEYTAVVPVPADMVVISDAYVTSNLSAGSLLVDDVVVAVQVQNAVQRQREDDNVFGRSLASMLQLGPKTPPADATPDLFQVGYTSAGLATMTYLGATPGTLNFDANIYLDAANRLKSPEIRAEGASSAKVVIKNNALASNEKHWEARAESDHLLVTSINDDLSEVAFLRLNKTGIALESIELLGDAYTATLRPDAAGTRAVGVSGGEFGSGRFNTLYLGVAGGQGIASHAIPSVDDSLDLGGPSYYWRNLYLDGTAYIDTLSLGVSAGLGVATSLMPTSATGHDLGSASYPWEDGYIDYLHTDWLYSELGHLYIGNLGAAHQRWQVEAGADFSIWIRDDTWANGVDVLKFTRSNETEQYLYIKSDVRPGTSEAYDLGYADTASATAYRWDNIVAGRLWLRQETAGSAVLDFEDRQAAAGSRTWRMMMSLGSLYFTLPPDNFGSVGNTAIKLEQDGDYLTNFIFGGASGHPVTVKGSSSDALYLGDSSIPVTRIFTSNLVAQGAASSQAGALSIGDDVGVGDGADGAVALAGGHDSAGWLQWILDGTTIYIPYWTDITT